jgi:hypothetical protein
MNYRAARSPQRAAATGMQQLQHPKYLGMRLASLIANWRCVPRDQFYIAGVLHGSGINNCRPPPFVRPFLDKHIGNSTIIWVQPPPK